MRHNDNVGTALIDSGMSEGAIYQALYDAVGSFVGASDITIYNIEGTDKAQLGYHHLKEGRQYRVEKSEHSTIVQASSTMHTAQNIVQILAHWGLQHAANIFEGRQSIAPRSQNCEGNIPKVQDDTDTPSKDPLQWPRNFSQQLRTFAKHTQGRHQEAMQLLNAEVEKRKARNASAVLEAIAEDIRKAMKEKVKLVAQGAWTEVKEEDDATRVYAGGLSEALSNVENEEGQDVDSGSSAQFAQFAIAMLQSRAQPGS